MHNDMIGAWDSAAELRKLEEQDRMLEEEERAGNARVQEMRKKLVEDIKKFPEFALDIAEIGEHKEDDEAMTALGMMILESIMDGHDNRERIGETIIQLVKNGIERAAENMA